MIVDGSKLKSGHSKSCGCLIGDVLLKRNFIHGNTFRGKTSKEYHTWSGMKKRCYNPKEPAYRNYGGRGIEVCPEWKDSFETFLVDMGPAPGSEYSIDRINNDGNYEPSNCRWATRGEQNVNKRTTRWLEYDGKNLPCSEWSKITGLSPTTLCERLQDGWSAEKILTTPKADKHQKQPWRVKGGGRSQPKNKKQ